MQLSLTQPRSWTLLLLLVSNQLLWENVASVPMCAMRNGRCFNSLGDMFDVAGSQSHEISQKVSEMLTEFKNHYAEAHSFNDTVLSHCHTSSLSIPESEATKKQFGFLLNRVGTLLNAWEEPLRNLNEELSTLKGIPAGVISKVKDIKEKSSGQLVGIKTLLNVLYPRNAEAVNFPTLPEVASPKSAKEDVRILGYYNKLSCLDGDYKKIDIYLNVIKCKNLKMSNC
ncbi:prolactin-2C2-like [Alexandromys fortis]|uniref:prolactin-2C2-like n=1 Tax=Alexandromys fortis TaxID=100897 RepID=UPI002152DCF8|nr:prolactin-2C2-like [Microtus fortis]